MDFHVIKNIKHKPDNSFPWVIAIPVLIIAIPVIVLTLICLFIYFAIQYFFFKSNEVVNIEPKPYIILNNEKVKIELKKLPQEFEKIDDYWSDEVFDEEEYLYVAQSNPKIELIDGKIFGNFILENEEGAFLQKVIFNQPNDNLEVSSLLLYLNFQSLEVKVLDQFGPYFLYTKKEFKNKIYGFNKEFDIELEIKIGNE